MYDLRFTLKLQAVTVINNSQHSINITHIPEIAYSCFLLLKQYYNSTTINWLSIFVELDNLELVLRFLYRKKQ